MTTHNHSTPDRSPPGSTRAAPSAVHQDGGVKYATGASSKIRGRDNINIGTWNTRTLRASGKLQEVTHEMDRYRWNILGLCEMRRKNFGETTTEEGHKVFSAVRVRDSQAYRKMDVTRERISCILELREIPMSFQTGFNLVKAAIACAFLRSISSLEPSSVITEPRYLKLVTASSFCPFTLISVLTPLVLFVISLVFTALISML